jgi:hypothetical protein
MYLKTYDDVETDNKDICRACRPNDASEENKKNTVYRHEAAQYHFLAKQDKGITTLSDILLRHDRQWQYTFSRVA